LLHEACSISDIIRIIKSLVFKLVDSLKIQHWLVTDKEAAFVLTNAIVSVEVVTRLYWDLPYLRVVQL
jgi:hypothetical protein